MNSLIPSALDLRQAVFWIGLVFVVAVVMGAYYRFLVYLEDRLQEFATPPLRPRPEDIRRRVHLDLVSRTGARKR